MIELKEENEKKASELWWEKIHLPQEKIIESFYQDLHKVYSDQVKIKMKIY